MRSQNNNNKEEEDNWLRLACHNMKFFTHPLSTTSTNENENAFIIANILKLKSCDFDILKFDVRRNEWNQIEIQGVPTNKDQKSYISGINDIIVNALSLQTVIGLPLSADSSVNKSYTAIIDHHGRKNVTFDVKKKIFYAQATDGNVWKVDMSQSNQAKQEKLILNNNNNNNDNNEQPTRYFFMSNNNSLIYMLSNRSSFRHSFQPTTKIVNRNVYMYMYMYYVLICNINVSQVGIYIYIYI